MVSLPEYYGPLNAVDEEIATLSEALARTTPEQRAHFSESLNRAQRQVVGRFALRASVLALRSRDARYLRAGLLAHVILRQHVSDWRDDLVFFAPYYHVAQVLGTTPQSLFNDVAEVAVSDLASVMRQFGARQDVTLQVFGWREQQSEHGLTFEQMGWGHAPSGALIGEESWDRVHQAEFERLKRWMRQSSDDENRE